jgi:hypothetical protein
LGQRVGDGECTDLAVEALRHAGAAHPRPRLGVWGDELESLRDARPGDVLQFEDAVFIRRRIREDGAIITQSFSFPHHTAIVARVRKRAPAAGPGHPSSECQGRGWGRRCPGGAGVDDRPGREAARDHQGVPARSRAARRGAPERTLTGLDRPRWHTPVRPGDIHRGVFAES